MRAIAVAVATIVLWVAAAAAVGADQQVPETEKAASQELVEGRPLAAVVIDGETLFRVRGVSVYPPDRRARVIEDRIRAVAEDGTLGPITRTTDEQPDGTWVVISRQRIMLVHAEDAVVEGADRGVLAELYGRRIEEAIVAFRQARQPAVLARHTFLALGATLVLLAVIFFGHYGFRWVREDLRRRGVRRAREIAIKGFEIVNTQQVEALLHRCLSLVWVFVVLTLLYFYLRYALSLFPWTRGLSSTLFTIVVDPLRTMGLGFVAFIPNLVFLAILFAIARGVLTLIRGFFAALGRGAVKLEKFEPDWALPTYKLVRVFVVALALVIAYPYVPGSQTEAFKGISLFVGVVFSLGSSSFVSNLIAGYSLTYRRAFKVGDIVRMGDFTGTVVHARMLVTHLRTLKNEEVTVPNSKIVGTEVVNFTSLSQERGLILHTTVGIGYETPWRQVEAMLIEAARRTPGLRADPPPFVLQLGLEDFAVKYEINVYCETPQRMRLLYTELHRNILDVFNEYGVQIMTPAYEGDPPEPKVVPKEQWYTAPAPREERIGEAGL